MKNSKGTTCCPDWQWWQGEQLTTPYRLTPHKCPVCYGRGTVPDGFYEGIALESNNYRETCRACDGKGVIYA